MKRLISILAKMKKENVIGDYAIGGATALVYYFEPINTLDIDVFVLINSKDSPIVNLSPIYDFMKKEHAQIEKEYVIIENTPVQFLVPYNALLEEAVRNSVNVKYSNVKVRIIPLEYLMAIMVQTGRTKNKARLEELIFTEVKFDKNKLEKILLKHKLFEKWKTLKKVIDR